MSIVYIWNIFPVVPDFVLNAFFFLAALHGLCEFSSLTRDQTWALSSESAES